MRSYSLTRVPDAVLLREVAGLFARDRENTAELLAHVAEIDARKLFRASGHSSMRDYCVREFHLSEDAASKRIQAARAARDFPVLFTALADGRLHLTAIRLLAPHLTAGNVDELLAAATHRTRAEVELLIAERFPRSEELPLVEAIPASSIPADPHAVEQVEANSCEPVKELSSKHAPGPVRASEPRSRVAPVAPERFSVHFMMSKEAHDTLRDVQALLSHQVPSGDLEEVFHRALSHFKRHLEKQKFAATDKPRPPARRSSGNSRYIPAHVKRAVRERDQDQCTFVSETGQRCGTRGLLQFDHVDPVARGGQSTVDNLRLRCRAHNQLEAERVFGAGFMAEKREGARRAAADARARAEAEARTRSETAKNRAHAEETEARDRAAAEEERAAAQQHTRDVIAGLRNLGVRADQARRAAKYSEALKDATLEERMRAALTFICPKPRSDGRAETNTGVSA